MCSWWKLLQIPWIARKTDIEVLDQIKPGTSLEAEITILQLTDHIMRANSLEKSVMLGMVCAIRSKRDGKEQAGLTPSKNRHQNEH